jgi:hypothetical protein
VTGRPFVGRLVGRPLGGLLLVGLLHAGLPLADLPAVAPRPAGAATAEATVQEAPRLTWLVPGFLPERGLLTLGLRGSRYHPGYNPTGGPAHYDVVQATLYADWSPLSHLSLSVAQSWRAWSNYVVDGQPLTGSDLGDGSFRAAVAVPALPAWLGLVVWGGGNLPIGAAELGEEVLSPEAGATGSLAIWRGAGQIPELRLHASLGHRWNRNEDHGYGTGQGIQPQPWFPQYPAAAEAGGADRNDFLFWGAALEFRQRSAALWVEWSAAYLYRARNVSVRENQQILAAGLRWGLREAWALHADYQVGFWADDPATVWYPRQSHLGFTLAISRQFGFWRGQAAAPILPAVPAAGAAADSPDALN